MLKKKVNNKKSKNKKGDKLSTVRKILQKFKINFKSIQQHMITSFAIIIVFILVISAISGVSALQSNKVTNEIIDEQFANYRDLKHLSQNFIEQTSLAHEYLLTENNSRLTKFNKLIEENEGVNTELLERNPNNEEIETLIDMNEKWVNNLRESVFIQVKEGNDAVALQSMSSIRNQTQNLVDSYTQTAIAYDQLVSDTGADLSSSQSRSIIVTSLLAVVTIILSIIIAWYTAQTISNPVNRVKDRLNEIAANNLSSEPLEVTTEDEMGELAHALNITQGNLIQLIQDIMDSSKIIAENSNELTQAGIEVQNGSTQITATMQELASGTEQQASSASNLSETMNRFVERISETSIYGEDIKKDSDSIAQKAEDSSQMMTLSNDQMRIINDIVAQAVDQMEQLNLETNQISNLVDIINGIAQQTNLLALNASIEAARAGEQGRGFAVVAEEVRKLSEEVADSVTEITSSVERVQKDTDLVSNSLQGVNAEVEVGTIQIEATTANLNEIMQAMDNMQIKNNQMSVNLDDIAKNTDEIDSQISEVASVSEETAAGVEETSASTEEINSSMDQISNKASGLQHISEVLDSLVNQVKL